MQNILLFAVLGLGEGALIAALAISVVVFYRGSGTVNLSMGAIAMVASYLFYSVDSGVVRLPSALVARAHHHARLHRRPRARSSSLACSGRCERSSPLAKLAASLGLLLLAQSLIAIIYGNSTLSPTSILPSSTVHLFGQVVPVDRMILLLIAVVLAAALWALYRFSQFGLATRAAAESEPYAMYAGLSPRRLSLVNSLLASVIAGAFGILVAPLITLNTTTLPLEIVPALGAALFAGFSSLGVACFAGLLMGAGASLLNYWASQSWFPQSQGNPLNGLPELLFFVLVAVAMFWRGSKVPARGELTEKRMPLAPRPENLTRNSVIALVVGVVLLIVLPYDFRQAMVNSMLGAMICLSLIVVIGYVGQISVVQVAPGRRHRVRDVAHADQRRRCLGGFPDRAARRHRRRADRRLHHRGRLAAGQGREPRRGDAGRRGARSRTSASATRPGARRRPGRRSARCTSSASTCRRRRASAASTARCRARSSAASSSSC